MEDLQSLRAKEKEEFKQEENQRLNKAIALLSTDDDDSKRHDDISSKLDTQTKHSEKLEKHNKEILKIVKKDSLAHKAVQDNIGKLIEKTTNSAKEIVEQTKKADLKSADDIIVSNQRLLTGPVQEASEERKGLLQVLKDILASGRYTITQMIVDRQIAQANFIQERADRINQRKEEKADFKEQVAARKKEIRDAAKADKKRAKIEKLANKESLLEMAKNAPGKALDFSVKKIKGGVETLFGFIKTALKGAALIALVLAFNTFIKSDAFKNLIEYLRSGQLVTDLESFKERLIELKDRIKLKFDETVDFFEEWGVTILAALGTLGAVFVGFKLAKAIGGISALVKGATPATKTVTKTATNAVTKTAAKKTGEVAAKGIAKGFLKKLPGLGLIMGSAFAVKRAIKGDFVGAALELGGGIASTVPGVGTALSLATEAALIARDINKANKLAQANRDANQSTNGNNIVAPITDASTKVVNNSQQTTNVNGGSMPVPSLPNNFGYDEALAMG